MSRHRQPMKGCWPTSFQLSIAAMAPAGLLFLATTEWSEPWPAVKRLIYPTLAVMVAFGLLYYFEHLPPSTSL